MNSRKIYLILLQLLIVSSLCQGQSSHLNLILFIDDKIARSGVYDGVFITKDSLSDIQDSIPFHYEVGDLDFKNDDFSKLMKLSPNSKIIISFKYSEIYPIVKNHVYFKETTAFWLIQKYVILKVYNFDNIQNYKYFSEKVGYCIDIEIPANRISHIRKINTKNDEED